MSVYLPRLGKRAICALISWEGLYRLYRRAAVGGRLVWTQYRLLNGVAEQSYWGYRRATRVRGTRSSPAASLSLTVCRWTATRYVYQSEMGKVWLLISDYDCILLRLQMMFGATANAIGISTSLHRLNSLVSVWYTYDKSVKVRR